MQYLGDMQAIVVITTVGTEEQAYLIARELVGRRQAACVNIFPGVRSIYRWKGNICKDGELVLIIKTLDSEFEAVEKAGTAAAITVDGKLVDYAMYSRAKSVLELAKLDA